MDKIIMKPAYWQQGEEYLSSNDEIMARIIESYQGEILTSRGNAFETLIRAIVGQQISVIAADNIWGRLLQKVGINAHEILSSDDELLRSCGLSMQKVRYIKNIATKFVHEDFASMDFVAMEREHIEAHLLPIKGVGKWTAEMFLIFHVMHPDIFPLGDIGLLKAIRNNYAISEDYKSQEFQSRLQDLSSIWSPYRTIATWYLWRSIDPNVVVY